MDFAFNFEFLFSYVALFIILVAFAIAYLTYSAVGKNVFSLLSFPFFLLVALFIILKDERGILIKNLERKYHSTKDEKILYQLASVYEFEGDIPKAIEVYMKIIESNPQDDFALVKLGIIMIHAGRKDIALEAFKTALKINPDNQDAKILIEILESTENGDEIKRKR